MDDSWIEHSSGEKLYECSDCLGHHTSSDRISVCPECGGPVENLSKARAE
ncbi:rubrerythrin-like domain-containing protein [Halolamina sp. CBA1230]|nr:rubrerythrin-like domain-containing protein [Halolamina sp. CBA1230]QKY18852.1 rubrerythrin-like domain-containing protein [Halolamina sp. CBA1230]